jgi:hypothetical protein
VVVALDRKTDMNTEKPEYHPVFLQSLADRMHPSSEEVVNKWPIVLEYQNMIFEVGEWPPHDSSHVQRQASTPSSGWPSEKVNEKVQLLIDLQRHFEGLGKYPGKTESIRIINAFMCERWPELQKDRGSDRAAEHYEFFLNDRCYPPPFSSR